MRWRQTARLAILQVWQTKKVKNILLMDAGLTGICTLNEKSKIMEEKKADELLRSILSACMHTSYTAAWKLDQLSKKIKHCKSNEKRWREKKDLDKQADILI